MAASTRTEIGMSLAPPSRRTFDSSITRSSLACGRDRHLRDLIQQQGSILSLLEAPGPALDGAGERAFFMAEQLALHQALRQRGAIHRYKWACTSRAQTVDRTGDQFLTGSAFAGDQDRGRRRRDLPNQGEDLSHRRRIADQIAQDTLITQLAAQPLGLIEQIALLNRPIQKGAHDSRLDGLFQKPEGLQIMNHRDRLVDASECRQNDGGSSVAARCQFLAAA